MIFRVIPPINPFLRQYIRSYMLCHVAIDAALPAPVKAYPVTPEEGIAFQIRGQLQVETPELNTLEKRAKAVFLGVRTQGGILL